MFPATTFGARSDAAGKLTFSQPIAPDHYSIQVDRRTIPEGCYLQTIKLGGEEISAAGFVVAASTELEIVLSSTAGTIAGSVTEVDGKLFPGAAVTAIPTDEKSQPVKQSADDDGNFKVSGLRPGKYKLFAWEAVDDALWQDPEFRQKFDSRATEITVGPSEVQSAQPRLIPVEEMK